MPHINSPAQAGKIVAARRKAKGLSQQQLAASLNISQNRLSELENQPQKLTLDRLLELLNILGLELAISERPSTAKTSKAQW